MQLIKRKSVFHENSLHLVWIQFEQKRSFWLNFSLWLFLLYAQITYVSFIELVRQTLACQIFKVDPKVLLCITQYEKTHLLLDVLCDQ